MFAYPSSILNHSVVPYQILKTIMKRIAALSLTIASIVLLTNPAEPASAGVRSRILQEAAKEGVEQSSKKATKEASKQSIKKAAKKAPGSVDDAAKRARKKVNQTPNRMLQEGANADAVRGLPNAVDKTPGNKTPNKMLEEGAKEANLDPKNAIKGAPEPETVENLQPEVNIPASATSAAASSISDSGSGAALPIGGGAALVVGYGIYRVIKR